MRRIIMSDFHYFVSFQDLQFICNHILHKLSHLRTRDLHRKPPERIYKTQIQIQTQFFTGNKSRNVDFHRHL